MSGRERSTSGACDKCGHKTPGQEHLTWTHHLIAILRSDLVEARAIIEADGSLWAHDERPGECANPWHERARRWLNRQAVAPKQDPSEHVE